MMQNPLLQLIMLIVVIWTVMSLLLKTGWGIWLIPPIILAAALGAAVLWLLRNRLETAKKLYKYQGCKQIFDVICKISKEQPPVDIKEQAEVLLREPADYDRAAEELLKLVRGHDEAIREMMGQLSRMYRLRSRTVTAVRKPPLGTFLLVGPEGVGKVYTAMCAGQMMFNRGGLLVMDMRDCRDSASAIAALFGTGQGAGRLVSAVRAHPFHCVILENIDTLNGDALEQLRKMLAAGAVIDPASGGRVSFENCLFFMTATKGVDALRAIRSLVSDPNEWHRRADETLASETPLSSAVLGAFQGIYFFDRLDDLASAEALVMLMQKECRDHRVFLEFVSPEILAEEVSAISPSMGLQLMPKRIERLLREPLLDAAQNNQNRIVLDRRSPPGTQDQRAAVPMKEEVLNP